MNTSIEDYDKMVAASMNSKVPKPRVLSNTEKPFLEEYEKLFLERPIQEDTTFQEWLEIFKWHMNNMYHRNRYDFIIPSFPSQVPDLVPDEHQYVHLGFMYFRVKDNMYCCKCIGFKGYLRMGHRYVKYSEIEPLSCRQCNRTLQFPLLDCEQEFGFHPHGMEKDPKYNVPEFFDQLEFFHVTNNVCRFFYSRNKKFNVAPQQLIPYDWYDDIED